MTKSLYSIIFSDLTFIVFYWLKQIVGQATLQSIGKRWLLMSHPDMESAEVQGTWDPMSSANVSQFQYGYLRREAIKHGNYLSITYCIFRDSIIILSAAFCSILGKFHKFCNFIVYCFFHLLEARKKKNLFFKIEWNTVV